MEYRIDEKAMNYDLEWQFGRDFGAEFYSYITSGIQQLENGNRFISANSIKDHKENTWLMHKIFEVKGQEVFFLQR